jgi:putative acetyltransferase
MPETVRLAGTAQEYRQLGELLAEYENSLPEDLRHTTSATELGDLEGSYGRPNAGFIAISDGNLAGCIAYTALDPSTAVVKRLYVRPAFRNRGIARALVRDLLRFAREQRYERAVLDTDRDRLSDAYKLYLSIGFRECEPYGEVDYRCPTYMELRL